MGETGGGNEAGSSRPYDVELPPEILELQLEAKWSEQPRGDRRGTSNRVIMYKVHQAAFLRIRACNNKDQAQIVHKDFRLNQPTKTLRKKYFRF